MGKDFTTADVASELSGWATAGGLISMVLFPFAIPIIALTAIAALPLLLLALPVVVLALPVLAVRALLRKLGAARRDRLVAARPLAVAGGPAVGSGRGGPSGERAGDRL